MKSARTIPPATAVAVDDPTPEAATLKPKPEAKTERYAIPVLAIAAPAPRALDTAVTVI